MLIGPNSLALRCCQTQCSAVLWDAVWGYEIAVAVQEGDEVMYSRYAGTHVKVGEDEQIIMKESDVIGIKGSSMAAMKPTEVLTTCIHAWAPVAIRHTSCAAAPVTFRADGARATVIVAVFCATLPSRCCRCCAALPPQCPHHSGNLC